MKNLVNEDLHNILKGPDSKIVIFEMLDRLSSLKNLFKEIIKDSELDKTNPHAQGFSLYYTDGFADEETNNAVKNFIILYGHGFKGILDNLLSMIGTKLGNWPDIDNIEINII